MALVALCATVASSQGAPRHRVRLLPSYRYEYPLVTLFVLPESGADWGPYLPSRGEFAVEDGPNPRALQPAEIVRFVGPATPLSIAVLLDTSGSMLFPREKWTAACDAANAFLGSLRPTDECLVMSFGTISQHPSALRLPGPASPRLCVEKEWSSDPAPLMSAANDLTVNDSATTPMYDAVAAAASLLQDRPAERRRVMVLFSDGFNHGRECVLRDPAEAIRAARSADVEVLCVGYGAPIDDRQLEAVRQALEQQTFDDQSVVAGVDVRTICDGPTLRRIATETTGLAEGDCYWFATSGPELLRAFEDAYHVASTGFRVTYRAEPATPHGRRHLARLRIGSGPPSQLIPFTEPGSVPRPVFAAAPFFALAAALAVGLVITRLVGWAAAQRR